jgi:hypothetical protein
MACRSDRVDSVSAAVRLRRGAGSRSTGPAQDRPSVRQPALGRGPGPGEPGPKPEAYPLPEITRLPACMVPGPGLAKMMRLRSSLARPRLVRPRLVRPRLARPGQGRPRLARSGLGRPGHSLIQRPGNARIVRTWNRGNGKYSGQTPLPGPARASRQDRRHATTRGHARSRYELCTESTPAQPAMCAPWIMYFASQVKSLTSILHVFIG